MSALRTVVRVEREIKMVSRKLMREQSAMGGYTRAEYGLGPEVSIGEAHGMLVRGWGKSRDGILGYLAQWGHLEREVQIKHVIRVYCDNKLVYEEER